MIRLPDIPGVQPQQINAPMANPRAAAAPALALQGVAESIGQAGQMFHNIAMQVQKMENGRRESEERMKLDLEYAALQRELDKDPEPANRIKRTQEFFAAYKGRLDAPDMPPALRDSLMQHFDGFATRETIAAHGKAAKLTAHRARLQFGNELDLAMESMDEEKVLDVIARYAATGDALPEEIDKMRRDAGIQLRTKRMQVEMMDDPSGWLEKHQNAPPPPGFDPISWRNQIAHAQGLKRSETLDAAATIQDGIITGDVTTPEQIQALAGDMRPAAILKLTDFLQGWNDSFAKAERETPEYQHGVVGRVSELLQEYNPELEDFDEKFVEMDSLTRTLPPGAIRTELSRQIDAVRSGKKAEIKSRADLAMQELDVIDEAGGFGTVTPARKIAVKDKVKDGFLKNPAKLQTLGFSEKQAEKILKAAREGPAIGQKMFQELWKERPAGSVEATPFDIALADSIRLGKGEMLWEMDGEQERMAAEKAERLRAKGRAKTELAEWLKQNPDAPDAAIMDQLREMGSKAARLAPAGGVVKPAPGRKSDPSTSMNIPAPLKPLAAVFEAEGRKHGIDPRFLAAISMHETGNGTSSAYRNKRNAMGVSDSKGPIAFDDPAASIARMARVLSSEKGPYRNAKTLAEIGRIYAPPGAGNDPRGLNSHWTAGVSKYLRQLGGDPDQIFLNA
jgi:hypothetical protein